MTKVLGPQSINASRGYLETSCRGSCCGSLEDSDPGELPASVTSSQISAEPLLSKDLPLAESGTHETTEHLDQRDQVRQPAKQKKTQCNPQLPTGNEYGPNNPCCSTRNRKYCYCLSPAYFMADGEVLCVHSFVILKLFIAFPDDHVSDDSCAFYSFVSRVVQISSF